MEMQPGMELYKWAYSNVILIICAYKWWGEGLSHCQILWTSCILSLLQALILSHPFLQALLRGRLFVIFSPLHLPPHFFLHFSYFLTSCLRIPFLLSSSQCWSLSHDLVTLRRAPDTLTAHLRPSVVVLFLVNLSESFPPCSWQVCVVGPDSRQS